MTIEEKALALVNEIEREEGENELTRRIMRGLIMDEALCRAIEQREAAEQELADCKQELADFRQEVSDAVWDYYGGKHIPRTSMFAKFAIPKPDPLREIAEAWGLHNTVAKSWVEDLRATLEARGFEIREKNDD